MNSRQKETKVFLFANVFLLLIVLFGFGRTFYLRDLFIEQPLPLALQLHGIALTLWFVFVVLQGLLILNNLRQWHIRVAWLSVPIVGFAIASGLWINTKLALGLTSAENPENGFIWGNYLSLLSFLILVTAGVLNRGRFITHHRLIFFASLTIIGPALARFPLWPIFGTSTPSAGDDFAGGGTLVFIALAIAYDLLAYRRVKAATFAGIAGAVLPQVAGTAIAISGIGYALLH